jgi:hypothetical protein
LKKNLSRQVSRKRARAGCGIALEGKNSGKLRLDIRNACGLSTQSPLCGRNDRWRASHRTSAGSKAQKGRNF